MHRWRNCLAVLGVVALTGPVLSRVVFLFEIAISQRQRAIQLLWNDPTETLFEPTFDHLAGGVFHISGLNLAADIVCLAALASGLFLIVWMTGFALAYVSDQTIWLTGTLFYLVVINYWRGVPPDEFILDLVLPSGIGTVLFFVLPLFGGTIQGIKRRALERR